jgi:hypothetical protein
MLAAAGGAWAALGLRPAWAAAVRGTVLLPAELRSSRRHYGYWHLENGNVPVQPPPYRAHTLVVLEGWKGMAPAARTVTVELAGLAPSSSLVVMGPGSVLELRNNDRVAHDLGVRDKPQLMPVERLAANGMRRQRFVEPGGYLVRCSEYPHIAISVIVVTTPQFALVDDKGTFRFPEVPDGKGTLRVWSQGRWVHDEPIEVTGKGLELQVRVSGGAAREPVE